MPSCLDVLSFKIALAGILCDEVLNFFSLTLARSVCSPPMARDDGFNNYGSPKGDVDRVLEAAAALTEMAGGPRMNPSASPPSVRVAAHRILSSASPAIDDPVISIPPKDSLCCTPAKRPAGISLWDGTPLRIFCNNARKHEKQSGM